MVFGAGWPSSPRWANQYFDLSCFFKAWTINLRKSCGFFMPQV